MMDSKDIGINTKLKHQQVNVNSNDCASVKHTCAALPMSELTNFGKAIAFALSELGCDSLSVSAAPLFAVRFCVTGSPKKL